MASDEAVGVKFGPMMVDWETRVDFVKLRSDRLRKTRESMAKFGVDYLLLVRQENGRYVTGVKRLYWPTFTMAGGPAIILPREGELGIWVIDTDFQKEALSWIPGDRFRAPRRMEVDFEMELYVKEVLEMFGKNIENATIGVDLWSPAMYKVLPQKLPNAKFVDGQEVMLDARKIKTPEEISCMKMAYAISEAGMHAAREALKPGIRECELVGIAFNKFWQLGSETSQCSQVVNSGPGSYPYRRVHSDRIIQAGDMVNMDFGACFNNYFGDFCRPFVCGKRPSAEQLDLLKRGYELQQEGLREMKPGVTPAEICKKLGRKALGHSIGISALEPPMLHETFNVPLEVGMTFSVYMPLIGNPRIGGVHIEDEIVITETGCEVYSTYPVVGVND
ncbi:MAG: Xaa-Pro peptidase family protein [Deltaproteobacteria bacterium]|nr:Xaa-Pro peptidase family protein [Deltaproteobacteria bacterium]